MFEGIDDVFWSEMHHAYGDAGDVPTWLRQVASESEEEQRNGLSEIFYNLFHQGSTYLATAYAVPYLLELLADPGVKVKRGVAGFLADVAFCCPSGTETGLESAYGWNQAPHIPFKDARKEMRKGQAILLDLLDSEDVEMRLRAAYILKHVAFPSEELHKLLLLKAKKESEPLARANLVQALGALSRSGTTDWQAIWRLAQANDDPLFTFCAALTLPRLACEQTPQEAVQLLATIMFRYQSNEELAEYLDLPFPESYEGGSQPWLMAAQELLLLSPERLRFMVPELRETLANQDEGWSTMELDGSHTTFLDDDSLSSQTIHTLDIGRLRTLIALLLHITFARLPDGKASRRPPLAELTEEQRSVLLLLCTRQEPWEMANTLKAYGLPYSWKMMSHYLERPDLASPLVPFLPTEKPESISEKLYNGSPHMQEMASVATDQYKIYFALQKYLSLPLQQSLSYLLKWSDEEYLWVTRNGLRPVHDGSSIGLLFTQAMLGGIDDDELLNMLALELGTFLHELHHIPVHELTDLDLPLKHSREAYESLYKRTREVLFPRIEREERENLTAEFETFLDTREYFEVEPVVVHGNFGPTSILYDETRHAIGGIALEHRLNAYQCIGLGDPASDFATILGPEGYGEDFLKRCEPAYPELSSLSKRISFHVLFRSVQIFLKQIERYPQQYKFEVRPSLHVEKEEHSQPHVHAPDEPSFLIERPCF